MCVFTIWLIGVSLTLRCVWEVARSKMAVGRKIKTILPILFASWVGALVYAFYLRRRLSIR